MINMYKSSLRDNYQYITYILIHWNILIRPDCSHLIEQICVNSDKKFFLNEGENWDRQTC